MAEFDFAQLSPAVTLNELFEYSWVSASPS